MEQMGGQVQIGGRSSNHAKRPYKSLKQAAEFATEFHGKFIARRYLPLSLFVATANILQKKI